MTKGKFLRGHKQVGKKFIPPMMQLPGVRGLSFTRDLLPELIWLGLINDNLGYIPGARLFKNVVTAANEAAAGGKQSNYAFLSTYASFSTAQKDTFLASLSTQSLLKVLRESLAPLVLLYDECPIGFLGPPETLRGRDWLVNRMKDCVAHNLNKFETPGITLNGMVLLSRLVTRSISFPANMDLPNFDAVIHDPASEEAKRAAAFMRANTLAEFGMLQISNHWARCFWNRGYELSPCEFGGNNE